MPDDGTLFGFILTAAAWIAWVYLVVAIIVEVAAAIRRIPTVPLPVLSLGQIPAKKLVAGVALLFMATPALAATGPATPAFASPPLIPPSTDAVAAQVVTDSPETRTVSVKRGDSLSKLAREHLGNSGRWDEIYDASIGIVQPGGRHLTDPDQIDIGWTLNIPTTRNAPTDDDGLTTVTVKRGDTLSKLAAKYLGDAGRWDEIFQASAAIVQPDGKRLRNPDHIEPGWTLHIPTLPAVDETPPATADPAPPTTATPETNEPLEPSATPATDAPSMSAGASASARPVPASTATPTPTSRAAQPTPAPVETASADTVPESAEVHEPDSPAWLVAGLSGAGALLAGSLWLLLSRRRRVQFRARRPGRTIMVPPVEHGAVEKTLMRDGGPTADVILQVDQGLRRLATAIATTGGQLPALLAVDVTPTAVAVAFAGEVDLPAPWQTSRERTSWWISLGELAATGGFDPDGPPPWPQLVTIGRDDDGIWRLLNMEALGVLSLTGDPARVADLARYLAAELATAPWARDLTIDCMGVCAELKGLNPVRLTVHDPGSDAVDSLTTGAMAVSERLDGVGLDRVEAARVRLAGEDLWESRALIIDTGSDRQQLAALTGLVMGQPGRTATSVLLVGANQQADGVELLVDATGRVEIPTLGLSLAANGLTAAEARGCVAVMAAADELDDVEVGVDTDPAEPWQELCDAAGNLRSEVTLPRGTAVVGEDTSTMLPEADERYLAVAAATVEDLSVMSPVVPASTRDRIERAVSSLDDDLAAGTTRRACGPGCRCWGR
ncbi:MAG: LysM peptidoglycan-binding domain-containing protein [Actinobacteria bacterium]|nr:LysM peptidoglycan-binding domain-containing protein [Actinomycetota bacterium]